MKVVFGLTDFLQSLFSLEKNLNELIFFLVKNNEKSLPKKFEKFWS